MSNEAEKFTAWYEQEKAKGLVDIKFCVGDVSRSTTESFFREANTLNEVEFIESDTFADVDSRPLDTILNSTGG